MCRTACVQMHVDFFLRNPVHYIPDREADEGKKMYVSPLCATFHNSKSHLCMPLVFGKERASSILLTFSGRFCGMQFGDPGCDRPRGPVGVYIEEAPKLRMGMIVELKTQVEGVAVSRRWHLARAEVAYNIKLTPNQDSYELSISSVNTLTGCARRHGCLFTCPYRYVENVLEEPEYFHLWAHHLKKEWQYRDCANGKCRGEPNGQNHMNWFDDNVTIPPPRFT